jgi:hypothetical protein
MGCDMFLLASGQWEPEGDKGVALMLYNSLIGMLTLRNVNFVWNRVWWIFLFAEEMSGMYDVRDYLHFPPSNH